MDSFYRTTGSSPPNGPAPRPGEPPLPEEFVEALAVLLAQALINDIRQYPDLLSLTPADAPAT